MALKSTIIPGITDPINRPPTDIPVTEAINTAGILGGIIAPWSAEVAVTAVLNSLSYPCLVLLVQVRLHLQEQNQLSLQMAYWLKHLLP